MNYFNKTRTMVMTAAFTAIIVIMANIPFLGYIPLGVTRATIIHVPVIIGAIVLGPKAGAFLGFVFGCTSLIANTFTPTITSFVFSPFYSIGDIGGNIWSLVICFLPRILIGVVSYYVYHWIMKVSNQKEEMSLIAAGIAGSLTNTILVMNLIYFLFGQSYASMKEVPIEALYGIILGIIGLNGIPEAIVASVMTLMIAKVLLKLKED